MSQCSHSNMRPVGRIVQAGAQSALQPYQCPECGLSELWAIRLDPTDIRSVKAGPRVNLSGRTRGTKARKGTMTKAQWRAMESSHKARMRDIKANRELKAIRASLGIG